jgi:hypothetical protein
MRTGQPVSPHTKPVTPLLVFKQVILTLDQWSCSPHLLHFSFSRCFCSFCKCILCLYHTVWQSGANVFLKSLFYCWKKVKKSCRTWLWLGVQDPKILMTGVKERAEKSQLWEAAP